MSTRAGIRTYILVDANYPLTLNTPISTNSAAAALNSDSGIEVPTSTSSSSEHISGFSTTGIPYLLATSTMCAAMSKSPRATTVGGESCPLGNPSAKA